MPIIRSSADLRNTYNDISSICHEYNEPVFITKNGKGDLAIMSIETYEQLISQNELYRLMQEGLDDISKENLIPFSEVMAEMKKRYSL